jgi:hypothetical protein
VANRGRDVDGPVAGAADVGGAALLKSLKSADAVAEVVPFAVGRVEFVAEGVIEAFLAKVALFFGDPFLKPHVRSDDED